MTFLMHMRKAGRSLLFYATGIDEGLQALKEGGVPPKLLIVDDGWQSTDLDPDLRPPPSEAVHSEHEVLPLTVALKYDCILCVHGRL